MSSPVMPRRLSSRSSTISSSKHEEDLINAYEAEEERIINVLSRKLEQLKEEKIQLENALEAESESHVNRLTRELTALRQLQQQQAAHAHAPTPGSEDPGDALPSHHGLNGLVAGADPRYPSAESMLEVMRRENEALRNRVVDIERDYIRVSRLNEIYREELIDHRRRLGLSVDNLIGLSSSAADPYGQPLHRRMSSTASSSPTASMVALPTRPTLAGMPIPRPPSQIHRPSHATPSHSPLANMHASAIDGDTPLSISPASSLPTSPSPFPFSPVATTAPASYATQYTTPPSSSSAGAAATLHHMHQLQLNGGTPHAVALSYPSVPPPSLSSSVGSPVAPIAQRGRSRRTSVERGARVAETGTLSRRGSLVSASPSHAVHSRVPEGDGESALL